MRNWWRLWQSIIRNSWAPTTQVRCSRLLAFCLLAACAAGQTPRSQAEAGTLEALARDFRAQPSAAHRAALEAFLLKHPKDYEGALARLVLFNGDTSEAGRQALRSAKPYLGAVADYVDWMSAATALAAQDWPSATASAELVLKQGPSALEARALAIALKAAKESGDAARIRQLLSRHAKSMSGGQRELYAGIAAEIEGKAAEAQGHFQKVYLEFPRSAEAAELGGRVSPQEMAAPDLLARALRLLDGGDAGGAKAALSALLPRLSGAAKSLAQVRIGVAEYRLRSATALSYLEKLEVEAGEADAERLFFALLAARRAKAYDRMAQSMDELNRKYPQSKWRLEGLANAAGQFWVMGESERSLPLYQACATDFQSATEARHCEWKIAVASHILRKADAEQKFLRYLSRDPAGEHASAALYFLGRTAEDRKDRAAAKAYYGQAIEVFPNQFYAELSRERMEQQGLSKVTASPTVLGRLREIRFPESGSELDFRANPDTQRRLDRANLLAQAALYDLAEYELRYEGRGHPQAHLLAMEAARMAARRGAPEQGIRYIKSVFPAYINLPLSSVTLPLLKLAYPLPYKDELLTQAFKNEVDPYLVAGLIRQESEFAASVVSRANAHGLMQIMPTTGRELARRIGLPGFSRQTLFNPQTNLQMGTYYFKRLLDSLGGSLTQSLASYNAGKGRVTEWLSRGNLPEGHDPAEFVETIPFDETRNYVQAVIRNAGMYRRIYGEPAQPVQLKMESPAPAPPKPKQKPMPVSMKKKAAPKKSRKG